MDAFLHNRLPINSAGYPSATHCPYPSPSGFGVAPNDQDHFGKSQVSLAETC